MVTINLITTGCRPGKVLAWSGCVAGALLLLSWFNTFATTTLDALPSASPGSIGTVSEGDDGWSRFLADRDDAPCYTFITPSPSPVPNPCEP
jgi:hypothetical protein